jgi:hypothetical protein
MTKQLDPSWTLNNNPLLKYDNMIMYDIFLWNWNNSAIYDNAIFIASYINEL